MAQQTDAADEAKTGIDFQTQDRTDIEAYADDGEHAVTWNVTLIEDEDGEMLEIVKAYHEAGLRDKITVDVIETSNMPAEHAREELLPNADEELQAARNHFGVEVSE